MKRIVTTFLFISLFLCVYARGNAAESQIQLVRNATLLIDYAGQHILLDPMLSPKGALGMRERQSKNTDGGIANESR